MSVDTPARRVSKKAPWHYKRPRGQVLALTLTAWLGSQTIFLLLTAAIIGACAAYGAILFRWLIQLINRLAYPAGIALAELSQLPWYKIMLVPAVGGLVVGPLIYFLAREARGHGVPEVMDAVANNEGKIRPRVAVVKILASAISIGVGAAVGREGPIVQIGSSIGSSLGQFLRIDTRNLRMLVGCGAAAGIAATFNAPIAGAIFAIEVILGVGTIRMFTPLVVSSVVATAISRHYLGDVPAFEIPEYSMVSGWELLLYVLLGGIAALVGVGFSRGLYWVEDLWDRLPMHEAAKPALGGVALGALALAFPHVMGVGYETIGLVLGDGRQLGVTMLLGVFVAKMAATHLSLGAGFSGGVFAPSLFLGAVVGAAFGVSVHTIMPAGLVAPSGAYALVAMGAVVAAATHAPLTSILIVFEMSGDYSIMLPLMMSCFIASTISLRLSHESIYTLKLARRGTRLHGSDHGDIMRTESTDAHMRAVTATLSLQSSLSQIVELALKIDNPTLYVTAADGTLRGLIHQRDIRSLVREERDLEGLALASDLMSPARNRAKPSDSLADTLKNLTDSGLDDLPVTDEDNRLLGTISRHEIIAHYNRETLRRDSGRLVFVERNANNAAAGDVIELPPGGVDRVIVTAEMAGQSLRELDWRAQHGVNVLGVRGASADGVLRVPDPDEQLVEGDELIVSGPALALTASHELDDHSR